jgi:hypothetical protein
MIKREVLFFTKSGPDNTMSVIKAVNCRYSLGNIGGVIVPVTTGKTARLFSKILGDEKIFTVSEKEALSVCELKADSEGGLLDSMINRRIKRIDKLIEKKLSREIFF